jgi:hypothetical protein
VFQQLVLNHIKEAEAGKVVTMAKINLLDRFWCILEEED